MPDLGAEPAGAAGPEERLRRVNELPPRRFSPPLALCSAGDAMLSAVCALSGCKRCGEAEARVHRRSDCRMPGPETSRGQRRRRRVSTPRRARRAGTASPSTRLHLHRVSGGVAFHSCTQAAPACMHASPPATPCRPCPPAAPPAPPPCSQSRWCRRRGAAPHPPQSPGPAELSVGCSSRAAEL